MRLVETRGNDFIVEQRMQAYIFLLINGVVTHVNIYINNATIRFLFTLGKRVI